MVGVDAYAGGWINLLPASGIVCVSYLIQTVSFNDCDKTYFIAVLQSLIWFQSCKFGHLGYRLRTYKIPWPCSLIVLSCALLPSLYGAGCPEFVLPQVGIP